MVPLEHTSWYAHCTATQGEPLSIELIFLLTIYKLLVSIFEMGSQYFIVIEGDMPFEQNTWNNLRKLVIIIWLYCFHIYIIIFSPFNRMQSQEMLLSLLRVLRVRLRWLSACSFQFARSRDDKHERNKLNEIRCSHITKSSSSLSSRIVCHVDAATMRPFQFLNWITAIES